MRKGGSIVTLVEWVLNQSKQGMGQLCVTCPVRTPLDINRLDYLLKSGVIGLVQVSKTPRSHHQQE